MISFVITGLSPRRNCRARPPSAETLSFSCGKTQVSKKGVSKKETDETRQCLIAGHRFSTVDAISQGAALYFRRSCHVAENVPPGFGCSLDGVPWGVSFQGS
jgi:hypothetical protein